MSKYSIHVSWSEEDGAYVAVCPEIADISALGDTREEAVKEIQTVIEMSIETYKEEGWELPDPKVALSHSGQFRIRIPKSLHSWLATEAQLEGVSLNSLVVTCLANARGQIDVLKHVAAVLGPFEPLLTIAQAISNTTMETFFLSMPSSTPEFNVGVDASCVTEKVGAGTLRGNAPCRPSSMKRLSVSNP